MFVSFKAIVNLLCQFHRPFSNDYTPTTVERYAANIIELIAVRTSFIMRNYYYHLNYSEK